MATAGFKVLDQRVIQKGIIEAIQAGRHSPIEQWTTWCEQCGQKVSGIFHRTFDGKGICRACARAAGVKEAQG